MPVWISLLRGVNLGPNRRMPMAELRDVYAACGLENPTTHIASGNVLFRSRERSAKTLANQLERAIAERFGFRTDVVLRTLEQMRETVAHNPFAGDSGVEASKLLVVFLAGAPPKEAAAQLAAAHSGPERLRLLGSDLFIYYPNGMARAAIGPALFDKIIRVRGTGRNWNTVRKLLELGEKLKSSSTETRRQRAGSSP